MKIRFLTRLPWFAGLMIFASSLSPRAHACSSCASSLASDWESQGYSAQEGLKIDVEYTFIDQTQLRHGTNHISPSGVPVGQELEIATRSHLINLNLDYIFNADWGVSLEVPWVIRDHSTLGETHVDYASSASNGIGDVEVLARYQGFLSNHQLGVTAGLKLPTGSFWDTFGTGEILDRGLQAGTGTTDLLLGIYYFDSFAEDFGYFAQFTFQAPFASRSGYRPGTVETLNAGIRYTHFRRIVPQFQINTRISGRDTGDHADNFDSGGTIIQAAPGLTFEVTRQCSSYVFVQLPLYQNLNGYQLAPRWVLTTGVRFAF